MCSVRRELIIVREADLIVSKHEVIHRNVEAKQAFLLAHHHFDLVFELVGTATSMLLEFGLIHINGGEVKLECANAEDVNVLHVLWWDF